MSKALLITPAFWDPICPPLGTASLKSYAEINGHQIDIVDLNTKPLIFGAQREYFNEVQQQFPYMKKWNIERNGTEMLSLHQIVYLFAKHKKNYKEMVADVLNMDMRPFDNFMDKFNLERFDDLFDKLYRNIEQEIKKYINKEIDVVGCHLNNSTWASTLFILKYIKEKYPHIRTSVGGPGPIMGFVSNKKEIELFMKKNNFIDYFIIGEGENCFLEILNNKNLSPSIIDKKTLVNNTSISSHKIKMHDLPTPNFDGYDVDRYLMLSLSSSRGCPFECSFCAETVFWDGFRPNNAKNVLDQMDQLANKYQRSSFYICDSLSNHIIGPLTKLITENNKGYLLDCYLRADRICTDEKRTEKWKNGGLFRARLGMESASQRILDDMVKKTTPEKMSKSLKALSKHGILTTTLWIVGYSGETDQEFNSTISFIEENRDYIFQSDPWVFQYHPVGLSGSKELKKKGDKFRYSNEMNNILALSPYELDDNIGPAEKFDRLVKFTTKMDELNIPNPYTLAEMYSAIKRFSDLHKDSGWDPLKSIRKIDTDPQKEESFEPLTVGH